MQTGISTACFYPMLLEDAVKKALSLGFKKLEIFFNTDCEFEESFVRELKSRIDAHGAEVISVHAYSAAYEGFVLFTRYERRWRDGLKQYARYLKAAEILKARYFTFHGERSMKYVHTFDGKDEMELSVISLSRLCDLAKAHGVIIAQENVAWCKSAEPAYLRLLHEELPDLGFTLDIKQARRAEYALDLYLDAMGGALKNIHLNDYDGKDSCLLPTTGQMDYRGFLNKLAGLPYRGDFIMEVYAHNYKNFFELTDCAGNFDNIQKNSDLRQNMTK